MAQNTRTELKNKFKRGMYPTEDDFSNVFDSYVHKDDMVELEKVVQTIGNQQKTLATIINESKQEAIAAAVQQAAENTSDLSDYLKKEDIDSSLDSSSTNPVENQAVYAALEDKADKSELNDYLKKYDIDSSLDSSSTNPVENQAVYAALEDKADSSIVTNLAERVETAEDNISGHEIRIDDLEAFKERVRAFLEDADSSDDTINRWHEIENFLQGITDTQTLTGLLQDLKTEILAEIPGTSGGDTTGNYVKQIEDLDSYEGETGEIVQYIGQTDSNYTRGFFYEKRANSSSSNSAWNLRPAQDAEIIESVDYNTYNGKIKYPPVNTTHFSTANQYRVYDLVDGRELFLANNFGQDDWAVIFESDNNYTEYYADRTFGTPTLTWQVIPTTPVIS